MPRRCSEPCSKGGRERVGHHTDKSRLHIKGGRELTCRSASMLRALTLRPPVILLAITSFCRRLASWVAQAGASHAWAGRAWVVLLLWVVVVGRGWFGLPS